MLLGSKRCCCAYCQSHVSRFLSVPVSGHQGSTAWVCEPLAPRWAKGPGPNEAQLWIQSKRGHQITREFFSIPNKNSEIGWKATRAKERAIAADKRGQVIFVSTNCAISPCETPVGMIQGLGMEEVMMIPWKRRFVVRSDIDESCLASPSGTNRMGKVFST